MNQEKIYNIKDFKPIDDEQLIYDIDVLIADSHRTGYPRDLDILTEFFINYGIYKDSYKSIFEKKKMISKTDTLAPHIGFGYRDNLLDKKKPHYTFHINMTTLGQKTPTLYKEVSEILTEEPFTYYFRQPNGRFIRPAFRDEENRPEIFYKFDDDIDDQEKMSDKIYTYTKELQFFADKNDLSYDAKKICGEGAKFFQNLGLLDDPYTKDAALELAENVRLEMFSENRVAFGLNLKNIQDQNLLITIGCGLGREKFTDKTLKIDIPKDFRGVLLKQGIRFE